ncbi:hypothetical protein K469DRAFT_252844 [Zopfia rhizophila CBS 207.26]|uniref:Uncharacterized protein n=1 Tax=Zopfia rhizophila CBS 207.26 TaxID=1314779 RepID=A0A6A6DWI4_9PEZI|nr:hypothetical protein K469DRAFT_252844 [Zopfia rhizophila CBS 207.26]
MDAHGSRYEGRLQRRMLAHLYFQASLQVYWCSGKQWEIQVRAVKVMWHYFNKSGTFRSEPWFDANRTSYGMNGHIHSSLHANAPITERTMESVWIRGCRWYMMFASGQQQMGADIARGWYIVELE